MKISAFCLTTNATKFGYPFIESIRSWLPVVDELIVVDGGSTDGTVEMIKAINSSKIRIVSDEKTKWEEDWFYSRMGKNFDRGFHECTGDVILKFDIDYVLHEDAYESQEDKYNFKKNIEKAINNNALILSFCRYNFTLVDRYFYKKHKTLGTIICNTKKRHIPIDYGLDYKRWAWGYAPIIKERVENDLKFGTLINVPGNAFTTDLKVFNYGFCFSTEEQIREIRHRHMMAECRQQTLPYKYIKTKSTYLPDQLAKKPDQGLKDFMNGSLSYLRAKGQVPIPLEAHPRIMREKIMSLTPEQSGYNLFGNSITAKYYENK